MILHGFWRSSATFRIRIALNLKGIDYDTDPVDLLRNDQRSPEFLDLNPQGLIPVLEVDGEMLTQSLAILDYLDETHPYPPLLPGHPGDRARVRALAQMIVADIHPLRSQRVLQHLAGLPGLSPAQISDWAAHWVILGLQALETMLANDDRTGRFCQGDQPGLADLCLVPELYWARTAGLDLTAFPTVNRIYTACMGLAAFDRAHPDKQADRP